jgi:hypothetical protein
MKSHILLRLAFVLALGDAACSGGADGDGSPPRDDPRADPSPVADVPGDGAPQQNSGSDGVVAFPSSYAQGELYATVTRGSTFEEAFASREAIAAVQNGQPMPSGTVLTLLIHTDGKLERIFVREKRTGWAAQNPPERRNGDWQNQEFTADGTVRTGADITSCFSCHASRQQDDFSYTLAQMRSYDLARSSR